MKEIKLGQLVVMKSDVYAHDNFGFPWKAGQLYGVFEVTQYKPDYFDDISYKCTLKPIGNLSKIFHDRDFYTSDIRQLIENCDGFELFDDKSLAIEFADKMNEQLRK